MTRLSLPLALLCAALVAAAPACKGDGGARPASTRTKLGRVTISVVGTSDVHGHVVAEGALGGADVFAGYLANLRTARTRDGGGVILVDSGDMFQGTLESNLGEGAVVVEVMNALGYQGAAVGNHEFDFGPAGPRPTPEDAGDDPRGALKARAAEARFPFLAANIVDEATGKPVDWTNVRPSTLVEVSGVKVGIIGVTTAATLRTTMAANVRGLRIAPLADTVAAEAERLRAQGATVVLVAAHAGGGCKDLDDPQNLGSCDTDEEIMKLVDALPPGTVDAIFAGHTHKAMAHLVRGTPVVQAWANGRAFSRVDLIVDLDERRVIAIDVQEPRDICLRVVKGTSRCDAKAAAGVADADWEPAMYEGGTVQADARIAALVVDDVAQASARREESLGVTLERELTRSYDKESAVGNLFADMMLASVPGGADVALQNGGGLRANLPAGLLRYGGLYEAYPFDNRFARVRMTGAQLAVVVADNLGRTSGILSLGGVRARAACKDGKLVVTLTRAAGGKPIAPGEQLVVVTSDFLATGGDGAFAAAGIDESAVELVDSPLVRDGIATALREHGGTLEPKLLLDPARPRLAYTGDRPLTCK